MTPGFRRVYPAVFVVVFLAAPLAFAAEGGEKVDFKPALKEGQRWNFDAVSKVENKIQISAGGQVQQVEQSVESRRKGTVEVLALADGLPAAVRIHFDKECLNRTTANGQKAEPPYPLADRTVTLRKGADGKVAVDADNLDAATTAELSRYLELDMSIYPPHPVAVGDEWEPDTKEFARQFQLGPNDKVTIKCKLLAISAVAGRKTADVGQTGTVTKEEGGIVTRIDLGGVSQVDLVSGEPLQGDVIGKIDIKGRRQLAGANGQAVLANMAGDGKMEIHQTVRPAEGAAEGGFAVGPETGPRRNPPEPGGAGAPPTAPGPTPMPTPPDAPAAAGAASSSAFEGTFKGEGLTLELKGGGASLEGILILNDRKFPAAAHAEGNRLVGTFESEGNKFNFTATLDGNALTLTSDANTYALKRSSNPLDKPKPKNPLDAGSR